MTDDRPIALSASAPPEDLQARLHEVLASCEPTVVACSGGIDSLLLATVAHRRSPTTAVVHTVTPAVPADDTARVLHHARVEGWRLELIRSGEFDDERYLSNPADRCYYCKSSLYDAIADLYGSGVVAPGSVVVSGANLDDLGEYRPGLTAASEHDVRHPYVEAEMGKRAIRSLARHLGLEEASLAASPCLASRIYTGTRVTEERLRAIEHGEAVVRAAGIGVVRCRIRDDDVLVEVGPTDRPMITDALLADVARAMRAACPDVGDVVLDDRPYEPGRAFLHA